MSSEQNAPTEGLRGRKRAATKAAIERAAISLALEHGYEHVTVDMICAVSMVSQRTFFNYFGSKEGVILGAAPAMPTDENVDEFVRASGSSVLGDFLTMVTSALLDSEPDAELFAARRTLIMHTPELLTKATARMTDFEDRFVAIILRRYETDGRSRDSDERLEDEARLVFSLSAGAMNFVMREWLRTQPSPATRELLADVSELLRRITKDAPGPSGGA